MAQQACDKSGFVTLMSVLVISAVGVGVVLSLLVFGLASSRNSFAGEQAKQTAALANACAQEGLQQIRDSESFTGSGSLSLGQGDCAYNVINTGGQTRIITASGTVDTIVRKVRVTIDAINPQINIATWQEVADF